MKNLSKLFVILCLTLSLTACVGTIVGAVVDTTIEVAKIPFKVAGAVIDVASEDDSNSKKDKKDKQQGAKE